MTTAKALGQAANTAGEALWDPEQQIYVGGGVPNHNEEAVEEYLKEDTLRIFGYGSLCWGPGTGALAKEGVTTSLGRAIGYKRCWAQKSTDHRGFPSFPGIVCTLLKDEEVREIASHRHRNNGQDKPSMTEGVLYTIPPEQIADCLAELDFREKGGYARDIVQVIEFESGNKIKALLYRGTPDNPAFWERALLDLPFAAAVLSVSVGPSGKNDVYLFNLDRFMCDPKVKTTSDDVKGFHGDIETSFLARMVKQLQKQRLYFLTGCGSNQHNQLNLKSDTNSACLFNNEDAHEMKEIVVCTDLQSDCHVKQLAAGGGHSALLTETGELFLWGWNSCCQLGRPSVDEYATEREDPPLLVVPKLNLLVSEVALGFSHTLVIEKGTGRLFAFGSNERGQVDSTNAAASIEKPVALYPLKRFVSVAGGLFHSAAITSDGELTVFGCNRFGQAPFKEAWKPSDGSRLIKVACGRRHTILLDEHDRVWTLGENKYGQLGRPTKEKASQSPELISGQLGKKGSSCFSIDCGWSHCIAAIECEGSVSLLGWGRNDKGQLGLGEMGSITTPTLLPSTPSITSFSCGSESTMFVDGRGQVWGCGWNEHGNLGKGDAKNSWSLQAVRGARVVAPPQADQVGDILLAAGGAHVLAGRKA